MSINEVQFSVEPERSPLIKWLVMLGIGLGVLMLTLDVSIVNIALPTLVQQLHTNFANVQWVVLSYLLVITSLLLSAASLGDMFGKKRLYLGGLVLFTLSSLLCGLAPGVSWLIGFRALQGLGAVFTSALGTAIITEVFPNSERGRAVGMIAGIFGLGIALGPTVGGVLVGLVGWRSIFLVNVPLGSIASFIVVRVVPDSANRLARQRFDGLGALLMMIFLTCFAIGMTSGQSRSFGNGTTLALLATAALCLVCFLFIEARLKQPMLDFRLFRNLEFSLSLFLGLLVFMVVSGVLFIAPFFMELVLHYPSQKVGWLLAAPPILAGLTAPFSGALSDRFGTRLVSLVGLMLLALGCLLLSTFDAQMVELDYLLRIAPFGLGLGIFQSPNTSAIMGGVPRERLGIASGLLSLSRTLGQAAGVPLLGALFATLSTTHAHLAQAAAVTAAPAAALVYGLQGTLRIVTLLVLAAAVLAVGLWRLEGIVKLTGR